MKDKNFEDLTQRIDALEEKIDKITEMLKVYMEEENYFIAETAGCIATLKNIYEKKSRS